MEKPTSETNIAENQGFNQQNQPSGQQNNTKSAIKELVSFVIIVAVVVLPIRFFVITPFIVSGESMEPTFMDGQYLIVDKISYDIHKPQRGDVIVFHFPQDTSKYFIKRIIGLPGEMVKINGKDIFIKPIEGEEYVQLDEEYLGAEFETYINDFALGEDEFFVMGDNRSNSLDSRYFGAVNEDYIAGRALIRLLPITDISILPGKHTFNELSE